MSTAWSVAVLCVIVARALRSYRSQYPTPSTAVAPTATPAANQPSLDLLAIGVQKLRPAADEREGYLAACVRVAADAHRRRIAATSLATPRPLADREIGRAHV